jgi:chromate transporter
MGALVATLGVVLPSFVIILLVAALIKNFLTHPTVRAILQGVRPAVVGLILATAMTMIAGTLFGFSVLSDPIRPDAFAILILFVLLISDLAYRKWRGHAPSPILLILLSAGLGIICYL